MTSYAAIENAILAMGSDEPFDGFYLEPSTVRDARGLCRLLAALEIKPATIFPNGADCLTFKWDRPGGGFVYLLASNDTRAVGMEFNSSGDRIAQREFDVTTQSGRAELRSYLTEEPL